MVFQLLEQGTWRVKSSIYGLHFFISKSKDGVSVIHKPFCREQSSQRETKWLNTQPQYNRKSTAHVLLLVDQKDYIYEACCVLSWFSCVWLFATPWTQLTRLLCPWTSPGKNTGVNCHALLQGLFLNRGWNPHFLCLLHCRQILYLFCHLGSLYIWRSAQNEAIVASLSFLVCGFN